MKLLKFAKIDMMRVARFSWMLMFPLVGIVVSAGGKNPLFGIGYSVFGGFILSAIPFQLENRQENGLIKMLPAKGGDAIRGHFLYSFLVLHFFLFAGLAGTTLGTRIGKGAVIPVFLICIIYSVMLVVSGFQNTIMSVFRFENMMATSLIRMIPALLFLFASSFAGDDIRELSAGSMGDLALPQNGMAWILLPIISIVLFVILAEISGRVAGRK